MKIIVLEGLDKAGKHTQALLLEKYLQSISCSVVRSEFHRYDTATGEMIKKWLYGDYDVDQKTIELIMAADKQAQQEWFDKLETKGVDFLILDRYTTSQLVYAEASCLSVDWVLALHSNLRSPDVQILLRTTVDESMSRKGKNTLDGKYEKDVKLLTAVKSIYDDYFYNAYDLNKSENENNDTDNKTYPSYWNIELDGKLFKVDSHNTDTLGSVASNIKKAMYTV